LQANAVPTPLGLVFEAILSHFLPSFGLHTTRARSQPLTPVVLPRTHEARHGSPLPWADRFGPPLLKDDQPTRHIHREGDATQSLVFWSILAPMVSGVMEHWYCYQLHTP
jgi:hypothetical protein